MSSSFPLPNDHPLMVAWDAFKGTNQYENAMRWSAYEKNRKAALWSAFVAGYEAAQQQKEVK